MLADLINSRLFLEFNRTSYDFGYLLTTISHLFWLYIKVKLNLIIDDIESPEPVVKISVGKLLQLHAKRISSPKLNL